VTYCEACGAKNEADAQFCAKCGASLQVAKPKPKEKRDEDCFGSEEQQCFGLPHGGAVCGIIVGVLIIVWGLASVLGVLNLWGQYWPFVLAMLLGSLLVAGGVYSASRRRKS
jgi:ribosomal protein L40E